MGDMKRVVSGVGLVGALLCGTAAWAGRPPRSA